MLGDCKLLRRAVELGDDGDGHGSRHERGDVLYRVPLAKVDARNGTRPRAGPEAAKHVGPEHRVAVQEADGGSVTGRIDGPARAGNGGRVPGGKVDRRVYTARDPLVAPAPPGPIRRANRPGLSRGFVGH